MDRKSTPARMARILSSKSRLASPARRPLPPSKSSLTRRPTELQSTPCCFSHPQGLAAPSGERSLMPIVTEQQTETAKRRGWPKVLLVGVGFVLALLLLVFVFPLGFSTPVPVGSYDARAYVLAPPRSYLLTLYEPEDRALLIPLGRFRTCVWTLRRE